MCCDYPLDYDSTQEINLTKHLKFNIVFINLNDSNWWKRILELQKSIKKQIGCLT